MWLTNSDLSKNEFDYYAQLQAQFFVLELELELKVFSYTNILYQFKSNKDIFQARLLFF